MPFLLPVFPLKNPISFVPQGLFSQLGRPEDEVPVSKCGGAKTDYELALKAKWDKLIQARIRVAVARRKFNEQTPSSTSSGGHSAAGSIESYRLQFRIIDLNGDGLIDYKELATALDKIGDKSTEEERRAYFREVDTDQSDGVDFEEFLELVEKVKQGAGGSCLSQVCTSTQLGAQDVFRITQLTIDDQIRHQLF